MKRANQKEHSQDKTHQNPWPWIIIPQRKTIYSNKAHGNACWKAMLKVIYACLRLQAEVLPRLSSQPRLCLATARNLSRMEDIQPLKLQSVAHVRCSIIWHHSEELGSTIFVI